MIFNPKNTAVKIIAAFVCMCFLWQDVAWAGGGDFRIKMNQMRPMQLREVGAKTASLQPPAPQSVTVGVHVPAVSAPVVSTKDILTRAKKVAIVITIVISLLFISAYLGLQAIPEPAFLSTKFLQYHRNSPLLTDAIMGTILFPVTDYIGQFISTGKYDKRMGVFALFFGSVSGLSYHFILSAIIDKFPNPQGLSYLEMVKSRRTVIMSALRLFISGLYMLGPSIVDKKKHPWQGQIFNFFDNFLIFFAPHLVVNTSILGMPGDYHVLMIYLTQPIFQSIRAIITHYEKPFLSETFYNRVAGRPAVNEGGAVETDTATTTTAANAAGNMSIHDRLISPEEAAKILGIKYISKLDARYRLDQVWWLPQQDRVVTVCESQSPSGVFLTLRDKNGKIVDTFKRGSLKLLEDYGDREVIATSNQAKEIAEYGSDSAHRWKYQIIELLGLADDEIETRVSIKEFYRQNIYNRDLAKLPGLFTRFLKTAPNVIVRPRNEEDVIRVIRYAALNRIPIVPRGQGTWALGGAMPTQGGIVLNTTSFRDIQINPADNTVKAGCGLDFESIEKELNAAGLTLASSRPSNKEGGSVGGFVSVGEVTKGGLGINSYGYGNVSQSVVEIEVIDGSGNKHILKQNDGDFKYFFGTAGSFGIIIGITLKARPIAVDYPVLLYCPSAEGAFRLAQDITAADFHPQHIEIKDKKHVTRANQVFRELGEGEGLEDEFDSVLIVFQAEAERQRFTEWARSSAISDIAPQDIAGKAWDKRYDTMILRNKGDLLAAEVILPTEKAHEYIEEARRIFAEKSIDLMPSIYILADNRALVILSFLTDSSKFSRYLLDTVQVPILMELAVTKFKAAPYGYGVWFSGFLPAVMGEEAYNSLKAAEERFDPRHILNPDKVGVKRYGQTGLYMPKFLNSAFYRMLLKLGRTVIFNKLVRLDWLLRPVAPVISGPADRCVEDKGCTRVCPLCRLLGSDRPAPYRKLLLTREFERIVAEGSKKEGLEYFEREHLKNFIGCLRCKDCEDVCYGRIELTRIFDDFEQLMREKGLPVEDYIWAFVKWMDNSPVFHAALKLYYNMEAGRIPLAGGLPRISPLNTFRKYEIVIDVSKCVNCGKCLECLMGNRVRNQADPRKVDLAEEHFCRACFMCVAYCPTGAVTIAPSEEYENMGAEDFSPADIARIDNEAMTGTVPVSGCGTKGVFGGKGFDRYMFDFSVIIRPTRDGMREFIDLAVNLGSKLGFLLGKIRELLKRMKTIDIKTPVMLSVLDAGAECQQEMIMAEAARTHGTVVSMGFDRFIAGFDRLKAYSSNISLRLRPDEIAQANTYIVNMEEQSPENLKGFKEALACIPVVEFDAPDDINEQKLKAAIESVRSLFSGPLVLVRLALEGEAEDVAERAVKIARSGANVIKLIAPFNKEKGYYETPDYLPAAHKRLQQERLRRSVSLVATGVRSAADSLISVMLGADAVEIDRAAMLAIDPYFIAKQREGDPVLLNKEYGITRLENLISSWNKQIEEVLGAFGVRDIRRVVGETGRLIDLRQREAMMRVVVEDPSMVEAAKALNEQAIQLGQFSEDMGLQQRRELALRAQKESWRYSELANLVTEVRAPNSELAGRMGENFDRIRQDRRWPGETLALAQRMAAGNTEFQEQGQTGIDFGGGSFDSMDFKASAAGNAMAEALNRIDQRLANNDKRITAELDRISISPGVLNIHAAKEGAEPVIGAGPADAADMSYGSIGDPLYKARVLAACIMRKFIGTGEGGYPETIVRPDDSSIDIITPENWKWIATQIATGLFGVTEDTILQARKITFKFAQGAKPGLGGHLLAQKVTGVVAELRGTGEEIDLFSPFPFHNCYSIEDVKKFIDFARNINPDAVMCVKISTPVDVDHVAAGLVRAGADEIWLDGTSGGTGAAPDIAKDRIAMPIEYALPVVHKVLIDMGLRNDVILIASGGLRTPSDVAKAIILGADKVVMGTSDLVASGCVRCGNCETGCQRGIATTEPLLQQQLDVELTKQRIVNYTAITYMQLIKMLHVWGLNDIRQLRGRFDLIDDWGWSVQAENAAVVTPGEEQNGEGGCGVVGVLSADAISVGHLEPALRQMHNRGSGHGGGMLAIGCFPGHENNFALQINVLGDETTKKDTINRIYDDYLADYDIYDENGLLVNADTSDFTQFKNPLKQKDARDITYQEANLKHDPGDIYRFFVHVKPHKLAEFARRLQTEGNWLPYLIRYKDLFTEEHLQQVETQIAQEGDFVALLESDARLKQMWEEIEQEFVYRKSFAINNDFYVGKDEPLGYVVSHMKNGAIWKAVGYAEEVAAYWEIPNAHLYMGHQRFPTGSPSHPGGAHPFIGMMAALAHNGDFATFKAGVDSFAMFGLIPQFLTDTESAILAYYLFNTQLKYPPDWIIEALAPTTGRDRENLPPELRDIYDIITKTHIITSPDGPWFFIIGENESGEYEVIKLTGITDTSMLRPSWFAAYDKGDKTAAGIVASEKQAADAVAKALFNAGIIPTKFADWSSIVRGGSVDRDREGNIVGGGAVSFIKEGDVFYIVDKYGNRISTGLGEHANLSADIISQTPQVSSMRDYLRDEQVTFDYVSENMDKWEYNSYRWLLHHLTGIAQSQPQNIRFTIDLLTDILDGIDAMDVGNKRRSSLAHITQDALYEIFDSIPNQIIADEPCLVIDAGEFPAEGRNSIARKLVEARQARWKKFIVYNLKGQRFLGSGLGKDTQGVRIDLYGSPGDYAGASMMGAELHIHTDAQNEIGLLLTSGDIIAHGKWAGNTICYGAEGGTFIAGGYVGTRAFINAVSNPKGPGLKGFILSSALEYLAESLMGGTIVVMGLERSERGNLVRIRTLYPGQSILSGASNGKVVFYDPQGNGLSPDQYPDCESGKLTEEEWQEVRDIIEKANKNLGLRFTLNPESFEFSAVIDGVDVKIGRENFTKLTPLTMSEKTERGMARKEQDKAEQQGKDKRFREETSISAPEEISDFMARLQEALSGLDSTAAKTGPVTANVDADAAGNAAVTTGSANAGGAIPKNLQETYNGFNIEKKIIHDICHMININLAVIAGFMRRIQRDLKPGDEFDRNLHIIDAMRDEVSNLGPAQITPDYIVGLLSRIDDSTQQVLAAIRSLSQQQNSALLDRLNIMIFYNANIILKFSEGMKARCDEHGKNITLEDINDDLEEFVKAYTEDHLEMPLIAWVGNVRPAVGQKRTITAGRPLLVQVDIYIPQQMPAELSTRDRAAFANNNIEVEAWTDIGGEWHGAPMRLTGIGGGFKHDWHFTAKIRPDTPSPKGQPWKLTVRARRKQAGQGPDDNWHYLTNPDRARSNPLGYVLIRVNPANAAGAARDAALAMAFVLAQAKIIAQYHAALKRNDRFLLYSGYFSDRMRTGFPNLMDPDRTGNRIEWWV